MEVLRSGRWTVSGDTGDEVSREREFAEAFGRFLGARYCVATCNGSSAIVVALQAAGVRAGDEVLVPALTWIGCASAVLRLGAVPRFVDCEPGGIAMGVDAAGAQMGRRTKAILLVHPYCVNAEVESYLDLCRSRSAVLVEDCSHAHGARRAGKFLGTFGKLGVFSMQQSKVLTSGEGGAVVTGDALLYRVLQQYRADGRLYDDAARSGGMMLKAGEPVQGANYTLSEFHAAILLERLQALSAENELRRRHASLLNIMLAELSGIKVFYSTGDGNEPPLYRYIFQLGQEFLRARPIDWWQRALGAELQLTVERLYQPLPDSSQLEPTAIVTLCRQSRKRFTTALRAARAAIPESRRAYETCLSLPHRALLGCPDDCADIKRAILKVSAAVGVRSRRGQWIDRTRQDSGQGLLESVQSR